MSILRPYQRQALDAFWAELSPDVNRVAIEMATGLGKTITFAAAIDEWLGAGTDAHPRVKNSEQERALVLVHTDELVRQAVAKIQAVVQGRWTVGVVKAGQNEVDKDIIVASVQTLANPGRREQITDVGFIVVDECHHAVAKTYVDILEHFGGMPFRGHLAQDSPVPVLGVSATLARTDGQGLGGIWQAMPFSRSLPWGIRQGYLIDLVPYTITIPGLDATASDSALDTMLADSIAPEAVVDAWASKARGWCDECAESAQVVSDDVSYCVLPAYCPNNECGTNMTGPSTVLFAPLVKSAQAFADAFNAAGVKAEVVSGAMTDAVNQAVLARHEAGTTTVICNAMKLTEGWDSPRTMCVIVARPTQSVPLFVQMVGRGVRPWLDSEAPPREEQRCVLLCVQGTVQQVATIADLSENVGQAGIDGMSLLEMEDQWDLGKDIERDGSFYSGPVRVEQWDAMVRASSKAWKHTDGGVPFLPTAKRGQGYVFITPVDDHWTVWAREIEQATGRYRVMPNSIAPDLELAMALAEDIAQDLGGDIGALLADKTRAWRKGMPSEKLVDHAVRLGLGMEMAKILAQRAGGKAGKLSDLVSRVEASRVLDRVAEKIKERGSER